jgi:hypothetical protein
MSYKSCVTQPPPAGFQSSNPANCQVALTITLTISGEPRQPKTAKQLMENRGDKDQTVEKFNVHV